MTSNILLLAFVLNKRVALILSCYWNKQTEEKQTTYVYFWPTDKLPKEAILMYWPNMPEKEIGIKSRNLQDWREFTLSWAWWPYFMQANLTGSQLLQHPNAMPSCNLWHMSRFLHIIGFTYLIGGNTTVDLCSQKTHKALKAVSILGIFNQLRSESHTSFEKRKG